MANTIRCGKCSHYYEMQKPKPRGGYRSLRHGHCLAKTVYAKNKPGKPVYPAGAKVADLPHNKHQVHVVRKDTIVHHCTDVKER